MRQAAHSPGHGRAAWTPLRAIARLIMLIATGALVLAGGEARAQMRLPEVVVSTAGPVGPPPTLLPPAPAPALPGSEVRLVGTTQLAGAEVAREKVPTVTHVLTAEDVRINGTPSILGSLESLVGGVTLSNAQNNPFQPNFTYRGFEASPLVGNAQGLAVYVNGGRFNQAFGDTVHWDLIPSIAIHRMVLEGTNPAFGLNALGGSLSVALKNGFTYQGAETEVGGGSFGRLWGSAQYGRQIDNTAIYMALNGLRETGWRDHSPSALRQFYGDIGWRGSRGEMHLNLLAADNKLIGNASAPVELLAVSRSAVFTYPDETLNRYARLGWSGNFEVADEWSLQSGLYYSRLRQRTMNGDASDAEPCQTDSSFMCLGGASLFGRDGLRIPNFVQNSPYRQIPAFADRFDEGGPYAQLNRTSTHTDGYGATLQATYKGELFGRPNRFVAGVSFDGGSTRFAATSELGTLALDRGVLGPGIVIDQRGQPDESITPVDVKARNAYYGLYFSDVLDITDRLSVSLGGRYNLAKISLRDQIGSALDGDHSFSRFNPAAGFAYKILPDLTVYGGYSEANRAPTPAELSCADQNAPCGLTNFFVRDPPLNQVVARTIEAGLRGRIQPLTDTTINWNLGLFRTETQDDIMFVSSPTIGRAFFQNVGATRRQGIEAGIALHHQRWSAFAQYAYLDATFQSFVTLNSPENPFAQDGQIFVRPGNHLPGIARHAVKFGVSHAVTEIWKVGLTARAFSGKYLAGDESNLNGRIRPYAVFDLNTGYNVTPNVQLFGIVENLFNIKYETFGTFSPVQEVPIVQVPDASNTRSLSPGRPFAVYAGIRAKL